MKNRLSGGSKNMFKRSWLSIKRKGGRTVLMALLFFMMANLVLSTIIIKTAVNTQMDYAKASLGGTISLSADMDKIREEQREKMESGSDAREMFKNMERPQVDVETADKIADYSEYVKDYSYAVSSSANANGVSIVENNGGGGGPEMGGMGGPGGEGQTDTSEASLDADLTISGMNAWAYVQGVDEGTVEIKDGEYFDESSDGKVMVSYELAKLNNWKVGDKFTLKNIYTEADVELTIIGIYDSSDEMANGNTLYMNTATAAKFLSTDSYNDGNYKVQNVRYYMVTSEKADEFVAKIKKDFSELEENNLTIGVDTTDYDRMKSSIEGVGSFATTILIIVIVASVVIIALIVTINVRERKYEMGVLMSLGAKKVNVMGQIAIELLIVGTVGFALASVSGTFLAQAMGQGILESQIASSQENSQFGRPGNMPGGPNNNSSDSNSEEKSDENKTQNDDNKKDKKNPMNDVKLNINATPIDYLLLFVTGYLVIILALIVPAVGIMRYQPKTILTGKE